MKRSPLALLALSSAVSGLSLLSPCRDARADGAQDKAAAEALFQDAQALVAAGQYETACPKFAESARLDRGIGVMLYLADCYEHQGKTASAWVVFRDAEDLAVQRGDRKRASIAHGRATTLQPQLANLVLTVAPDASVPGLVIRRDGDVVGAAQFGTRIPIDPGTHAIEATAPGKTTRTSYFEVVAGKDAKVTIAPLEDAAAHVDAPAVVVPPPAEQPPAHVGRDGKPQRIAGIAVAGGGVVGITIGAIFGGLAIGKLNDSNAAGACAPNNHCSQAGATLRYAAESRATGSTVGFVVGGVLVAGGAVLYFTAPHAPTTVGLSVAPSLAGASVALGGHFD